MLATMEALPLHLIQLNQAIAPLMGYLSCPGSLLPCICCCVVVHGISAVFFALLLPHTTSD